MKTETYLLTERDRWITRAAIAAAHTLASTNGGYHPDTPVDAYRSPLDFSEMTFLLSIHEYMERKSLCIATETMFNGAWLILEEYHYGDKPPKIQPASLTIFSVVDAKMLALELRDNIVKDGEFEPNEGQATFMEGDLTPDNLWISATNNKGHTLVHRVIKLYEPGEQLPWFPG